MALESMALDALWALVASWPGARWLQASGTAYVWVSAAHILGLAGVLGGIAALDLRLLGVFKAVPLAPLLATAPRVAGWGLALALVSGAWLFSVRPADYAGNAAFQIKLLLVAAALLNLVWQHRAKAWAGVAQVAAGQLPASAVRWRAGLSLLLWGATVLAGRWIGFL